MPASSDEFSLATRAGYLATDLVARVLLALIFLLPYKPRVRFGGWFFSRVVAPLAGFDKRIRRNLALTHPDMDEAEVRRMCRAVPDNVGKTFIEIYSGAPFVERARAAEIVGPGLAALEKARAEGRPVILVTGHFGNYDAARANLVGRGFEIGSLYRRMRNPYFNAHYVRAIKGIAEPMFEQGRRGMMDLVKHLKQGGVVAVVSDLHAFRGQDIQFFGRAAVTSVVMAELALKYDAPLIPVYAIRKPDGLSFEIVMQAPIPPSTPLEMTQEVTKGLEDLVRDHMDQWFWIHRRWKPSEGKGTPGG